MKLVFRPEVQVEAAILVKNSSGCVANDALFGTAHFGEDNIQGLQLLGHETRSVTDAVCRIQSHPDHFSGGVLPGQGIVRGPSFTDLSPTGDIKHYSLHAITWAGLLPPLHSRPATQCSHSRGPALWGVAPAGAANARTRVSAASIHSHTWDCHGEWIE